MINFIRRFFTRFRTEKEIAEVSIEQKVTDVSVDLRKFIKETWEYQESENGLNEDFITYDLIRKLKSLNCVGVKDHRKNRETFTGSDFYLTATNEKDKKFHYLVQAKMIHLDEKDSKLNLRVTLSQNYILSSIESQDRISEVLRELFEALDIDPAATMDQDFLDHFLEFSFNSYRQEHLMRIHSIVLQQSEGVKAYPLFLFYTNPKILSGYEDASIMVLDALEITNPSDSISYDKQVKFKLVQRDQGNGYELVDSSPKTGLLSKIKLVEKFSWFNNKLYSKASDKSLFDLLRPDEGFYFFYAGEEPFKKYVLNSFQNFYYSFYPTYFWTFPNNQFKKRRIDTDSPESYYISLKVLFNEDLKFESEKTQKTYDHFRNLFLRLEETKDLYLKMDFNIPEKTLRKNHIKIFEK